MQTEELLKLLEKYKSNPEDLDLINKIAIGYSQNLEMIKDNEDYLFFEKAYKIKKTVKTTNNFANHLFYECYDHEKALEIQKECIVLKPKSYLPYLFYATILIELEMYEEAIEPLKISQSKNNTWNAEYNLGYCKYMICDYVSAEHHFLITSQDEEKDDELKSQFGLALVNYKLGKKDKVYKILSDMKKSKNFENALNDYAIGEIYFLYNDYESAKKNTLDCGINIDLFNWKELGYSIYIADRKYFIDKNNKNIQELKQYIQDIKNNSSDWKETSDTEKKEYIEDYSKEIKLKENYDNFFAVKPDINIDKSLVADYYGCSIFGCTMHCNKEDDE